MSDLLPGGLVLRKFELLCEAISTDRLLPGWHDKLPKVGNGPSVQEFSYIWDKGTTV